jgi:hypothetical protein
MIEAVIRDTALMLTVDLALQSRRARDVHNG